MNALVDALRAARQATPPDNGSRPMAADVKLLPLPEGYEKYDPPLLYEGQMFIEGQMRAYARAYAAHATATLQAEVEALRAEVEAWRELSDHVRAGACKAIWPDRYTDERTRDVAAALKRAERLAEVLARILENEASDRKAAEEFGGYVLDDELREEARAELAASMSWRS